LAREKLAQIIGSIKKLMLKI